MTDILDIEGILVFPWDRVFQGTIALFVLALIAYAVYRILRWRKNRAGKRKLSAEQQAIVSIQKLEGLKWVEAGKFKEYYFALDDIFRNYLTDRYQYNAIDRTSSEILSDIHRLSLPADLQQMTRRFLSRSELAKFADSAPSAIEASDDLKQLTHFVRQTTPSKEPAKK